MSLQMENALKDIADAQKKRAMKSMGTIPVGATPFIAENATAIDGTTLRTIAAAPGAGLALWITKLCISQPTSTEDPTLVIQDDAGTPLEVFRGNLGAGPKYQEFIYEPPVQLGTNKALQGKALSAVGDAVVIAHGFKGAP